MYILEIFMTLPFFGMYVFLLKLNSFLSNASYMYIYFNVHWRRVKLNSQGGNLRGTVVAYKLPHVKTPYDL